MVKFKIEGDFMPLHESSLRSAIKENYVKGKFSPGLNSTQVEKFRVLFQPIALLPESAPQHYVDDSPPAAAFTFLLQLHTRHSELLMHIIQLPMFLLHLLTWCHLSPMHLHVLTWLLQLHNPLHMLIL